MKCVVSDFDRTLYVNGRISLENLTAIRTWQEKGNWFVIATGRNASSIQGLLKKYGVKADALILNNGAVLLDRGGKEEFCSVIPEKQAIEVIRYLYELDDDGCGISLRNSKYNLLSKAHRTTQKNCDSEITIDQIDTLEDIVQIHCRKLDKDKIKALCEELNARFPFIQAYANVWNADIVAAGINKSSAIGWLSKKQGGFDEIRVVGDSANDIQMIRDYRGAAMATADIEIQAAADRTVKEVAELLYS